MVLSLRMSSSASAKSDAPRPRRRLFWKYVVVIVALVTAVLVASGGVELWFSYRENQDAIVALQHEKAGAWVPRGSIVDWTAMGWEEPVASRNGAGQTVPRDAVPHAVTGLSGSWPGLLRAGEDFPAVLRRTATPSVSGRVWNASCSRGGHENEVAHRARGVVWAGCGGGVQQRHVDGVGQRG